VEGPGLLLHHCRKKKRRERERERERGASAVLLGVLPVTGFSCGAVCP
jgi:hypothetical protein